MSPPLVSCIMPTYGRPLCVAESVALFLAQDYPAKELLIGNDCPGQSLLAELPGVRVQPPRLSWANLTDDEWATMSVNEFCR